MDFAILASGGVTVPIYPTLSTEQVAYILRDSEAAMVVVSTAVQLGKVIAGVASLPALKLVVATQLSESEVAAAKSVATSLSILTLADVAERGNQRIRQGWGLAKAFQDKAKQVQPGDLATIIYTSGTTGEPKGVMLTHANLASNLAGLTARFDVTEADTASRSCRFVTASSASWRSTCHKGCRWSLRSRSTPSAGICSWCGRP